MSKKDELFQKLSDRKWWVDKCRTDLYFLCRTVLCTLEDPREGYQDLYYPTHGRICDFVQTYAQPGHKLLILTPRGWIKSYIVTIGWTIQRMINNLIEGKRSQQIISNATNPNAKEFLEKIKYNLQYNERLRGLLHPWIKGELSKTADRWTMDEIQVGGCRVETGSAEGNLVSRHYGIMINDDLVNKENSSTKEQLLKVIDWWRLAQSLLNPDGIEINIGTRWAFDDLYGEFIDKFICPPKDYEYGKSIVEIHNGKYHLLQMDCYEDPIAETGSTFPTKFPFELLEELKKTQGDRFYGQYRNNPLSKGRSVFKQDWFRRYHPDHMPSVRNTIMLIDPSGKADVASDHTGIVCISLGSDKHGYITYGKRMLITDMALANWIIDNAPTYMPDMIAIEDNKFNVIRELLELLIANRLRRRQVLKENIEYIRTLPYILMEAKPRGRNKTMRIRNASGLVENGTMLLPHRGAEDLEEEMIRYPSTKDDVVDAFAYILDYMHFPGTEDPPKVLELSADEKMTSEEREEEAWDNVAEAAYATVSPMVGWR